jgi:hypothetical protein
MQYNSKTSIREILTLRGLDFASEGVIETTPALSRMSDDGTLDKYRSLLAARSFRKFVQRLSAPGRQPITISSIRQACGAKTDSYVQFLTEVELASREGETVVGSPDLRTYGHHLEWYLASLCREQLGTAESWNVKVRDLPSGGDFDVLLNAGSLIYVELKSARPSTITESELRHFLQRSVDLSPDLAILMIDTDDDIQTLVDRVNRIVVAAYRTMPTMPEDYEPEEPLIGPQTMVSGIHWGLRNLYLAGSQPSFLTQLRRCLRFYNGFAKHQTYLGGESPNFLTDGLINPTAKQTPR